MEKHWGLEYLKPLYHLAQRTVWIITLGTHAPLPMWGYTQNTELQAWFGVWRAFFRPLPSQMKSVPVTRRYFCASTGVRKVPLLSAFGVQAWHHAGVGKGAVLGWEAGAEHNYPTSTTFHAQRLLPLALTAGCCFFFFFSFHFVIFLGGI